MADHDIPVAYGTPLDPVAPRRPDLRTAQNINGGSSRVILPASNYERPRLSEKTFQSLDAQGFTRGLAEALMKNKQAFPLSIWVVDNSGSMNTRDGHRLVETTRKHDVKLVDCTRWAEMQQTVDYHAQMATLLKNPTVFRMLNDPGRIAGPQQFSIAERGDQHIDEDLAIAQSTMMNTSPSGVTPLVSHLHEIRSNIVALEPNLRNDGTKVVLVLATDGLPTDNRGMSDGSSKRQFVDALKSLEGLPVWIVIRLCTDNEDVVEYYNSLDEQLELSLEVLDDFSGEAEEVYERNKWLNYGLPLHRMREMGFHNRLFDLLDERKLSKDELREFFRILFGDNLMDGVPDPEADWKTFVSDVTRLVANEKKTWNPVHKRMEPWIDMKRLKKDYGPGWFW